MISLEVSFDPAELAVLHGLELSMSNPRANALSTKTNRVQEQLPSKFIMKT